MSTLVKICMKREDITVVDDWALNVVKEHYSDVLRYDKVLSFNLDDRVVLVPTQNIDYIILKEK